MMNLWVSKKYIISENICHSRTGGNPASIAIPRSRQNHDVAPLRGDFLIIWIPACAGMTKFYFLDFYKVGI